jgi:hypothetical protein
LFVEKKKKKYFGEKLKLKMDKIKNIFDWSSYSKKEKIAAGTILASFAAYGIYKLVGPEED